jgi:thiol-disulfide isomerase/thioredoxin
VSDSGAARAPGPVPGALLAIAVLLGCAAGGFWLQRLTHPAGAGLYPAPLAAHPTAAPSAPTTPELPAPPPRPIPDQLPGIALPGPDGALHRLSDFRGKLLLVNFWATWCEPCRREIPLLQTLRRERAQDGVEVVGIALDHRADVVKYASERHMSYPLLIGEKGGLEMISALGMDTVLPFSVFADRSGRIVTLKIGELHADEAHLILDRMGDLDAGRMGLDAAREQIGAGIARLNAVRAAVPAASRE